VPRTLTQKVRYLIHFSKNSKIQHFHDYVWNDQTWHLLKNQDYAFKYKTQELGTNIVQKFDYSGFTALTKSTNNRRASYANQTFNINFK